MIEFLYQDGLCLPLLCGSGVLVTIAISLLCNHTLGDQCVIQPNPESDPVKDGLMPQQAVIPVGNPMALVREVQEP
jgi:hypothetical protein